MPLKPVPMADRYNSWTVIRPAVAYSAHDHVPVVCDCGTESEVLKYKLTQGRSRSCRPCSMRAHQRDLSASDFDLPHDPEAEPGSRHGRWTALTVPYSDPDHRDRIVSCRCECGTEKTVNVHDLLGRKNQSCGCLKRDLNRARLTSSDQGA